MFDVNDVLWHEPMLALHLTGLGVGLGVGFGGFGVGLGAGIAGIGCVGREALQPGTRQKGRCTLQ